MRVIKIYNQLRRDCFCDVVCEECGNLEKITRAYDDRNYWDNVIPHRKCSACSKSTLDLGIPFIHIETKYAEHELI